MLLLSISKSITVSPLFDAHVLNIQSATLNVYVLNVQSTTPNPYVALRFLDIYERQTTYN